MTSFRPNLDPTPTKWDIRKAAYLGRTIEEQVAIRIEAEKSQAAWQAEHGPVRLPVFDALIAQVK